MRFQLRLRDRRTEPRIRNLDLRADSHRSEKQRDVARTHPDATVAGGPTDQALFRRPMNVNIARKRPGILFFQPPQPKDPGHDRIAPRRVRRQDFTRHRPVLEHRAQRRVPADFRRDFHRAKRSRIAAGVIPQAKLRGGNRIPRDDNAIVDQGERLVGDAHDDGWRCRRGRGADDRRGQAKQQNAEMEKPHVGTGISSERARGRDA